MFDIVSVGHFSIDSIILPHRNSPFTVLGGSPTYVSLAARRLDARVGVISKVGSDFPHAYEWWLEQEGIDLSAVAKDTTAQTTRFELKYNSDLSDRTLTLKSKAPPITIEDLPTSLKASAIHLAPIANEISPEVVERLQEQTDLLSLDAQGVVRIFEENGQVNVSSPIDSRILDFIDIYKSSLKEIEALTGTADLAQAVKHVHDRGVKIVIITLGSKGSILSIEGTSYNVSACTPDKIVDPTGAGDVFMGSFLAEYINGENILRCAYVGSAAASFVVAGIGPTCFGDKNQIYQRARELYEKEIKE